jgi:hypothetical protein
MRHRSTAAIPTLAFGAVLAAASWAMPATANPNSHPAGTSKPPAATTAPAFPTFVDLPADQAAHPSAADEWWYVVGHLNAHGHRFGYEVQIGGPAPYVLIAITDKTTGAYYSQSQFYPPDQTGFPPPRSTCARHRPHCRDRWMRCACTPGCRPAKSI